MPRPHYRDHLRFSLKGITAEQARELVILCEPLYEHVAAECQFKVDGDGPEIHMPLKDSFIVLLSALRKVAKAQTLTFKEKQSIASAGEIIAAQDNDLKSRRLISGIMKDGFENWSADLGPIIPGSERILVPRIRKQQDCEGKASDLVIATTELYAAAKILSSQLHPAKSKTRSRPTPG